MWYHRTQTLSVRAGDSAVLQLMHRRSSVLHGQRVLELPGSVGVSGDLALWFNPAFISLLSASDITGVARNLIS